ncbi:MAG: hypothetical protein ACI38Q_02140 [Candidatus Bruticola sp.]
MLNDMSSVLSSAIKNTAMASPSAASSPLGRGAEGNSTSFTARGSSASQFSPGQNLFGQVVGRSQNGSFTLRFGNVTLQAGSGLPFTVGQQLNVTVSGQQHGLLTLDMNGSPFSSLSSESITQTLAQLNLPMSEGNFMLASSLVGHGAPLDRSTFLLMQKVLAQLPPTSNSAVFNSRVGAALFLQNNQLPLSSSNILLLSNFIAQNPQAAQQLFSIQGEVRRLLSDPGKISSKALEVLNQVPGLLGEMILEPGGMKGTGKSRSKAALLFDTAKQTGIETNLELIGGGESDWELLALLRQLRQLTQGQSTSLGSLLQQLQDYEDNLQAQRLINQGKPDSSFGFYYMQIPLRFEFCESAEVWIRYRWKEDGSRVVDPDDCRLEFAVSTDSLGELFFTIETRTGCVDLTVKSDDESVVACLNDYLPVLQERIAELGWTTGTFQAAASQNSENRELAEYCELSSLEGVNVQA